MWNKIGLVLIDMVLGYLVPGFMLSYALSIDFVKAILVVGALRIVLKVREV